MNRRDFTGRLAGAMGALTFGDGRLAATALTRRAGRAQGGAPRVNGDRINQRIAALSEFGRTRTAA